MDDSLIIRRLKPADCAAYRQLRLELLAGHPASFGSSYEEESQKAQLGFEAQMEAQDPDAFVMGAFADETLVGMCGFLREARLKVRHRAQLVSVYVQAEFAGRGIGFRLLQAVADEAFNKLEIEQLELGVMAGNQPANALYERLGFREYGLLKDELKLDGQYYHLRLMVLRHPAAQAATAFTSA